jgi:hypothetical protein
MTKAEWLAEGKELGEAASKKCWEIGHWLVRGEEQFLGPVPTSKKARTVYFSNRRANWIALMREAETVTNLAEATLRKYAQVARNGVRVDGLPFAHHIEVQRCRPLDEKGQPRFSANTAQEILSLAKDRGWKVADTRAEVKRRFPTPKTVETVMEKTRKFLLEILKTIDPYNQLIFLDALTEEIPVVRERVDKEWTEAILRIFDADDAFDDPCPPF